MSWIQKALIASLIFLLVTQWFLNFRGVPDDAHQVPGWKDRSLRRGVPEATPPSGESIRAQVVESDNAIDVVETMDGFETDDDSEDMDTASQNLTATKLEFVHITKTAGSAIEKQAAAAGVKWGACHWKKLNVFGPTCSARDIRVPKPRWSIYKKQEEVPFKFKGFFGEPWHTPPHWFRLNPFENSTTFAVIRDPYDRAVSEYYSKFGGYKGGDKNNATVMNAWMHKRMAPGRRRTPHFLPQHYYVYDKRGEAVIDHVLRYEALDDEFRELMGKYNLGIHLPGRTNARHESSALTTANLTRETIGMMNEYFADDFRRLNYSMIKVDR